MLWPNIIGGWRSAAPCNLAFIVLAVTLMARGCRQTRAGLAILGAVLLIALTVARYFDLFDSLFLRGLAFIIIGAIIFAEGYLYTRTKKWKLKK
jgi:uncharacterized membrane protein